MNEPYLRGEGTRLITYARPSRLSRYGPRLAHAHPGAGPVLKTEVSWRTVSGIYLNTPWGQAWLYFRNWRMS